METQKKFQNKRLNKEDHKKTEDTAKGIKAGVLGAGAAAAAIAIIKAGPKKVFELAKAVIKSGLSI